MTCIDNRLACAPDTAAQPKASSVHQPHALHTTKLAQAPGCAPPACNTALDCRLTTLPPLGVTLCISTSQVCACPSLQREAKHGERSNAGEAHSHGERRREVHARAADLLARLRVVLRKALLRGVALRAPVRGVHILEGLLQAQQLELVGGVQWGCDARCMTESCCACKFGNARTFTPLSKGWARAGGATAALATTLATPAVCTLCRRQQRDTASSRSYASAIRGKCMSRAAVSGGARCHSRYSHSRRRCASRSASATQLACGQSATAPPSSAASSPAATPELSSGWCRNPVLQPHRNLF